MKPSLPVTAGSPRALRATTSTLMVVVGVLTSIGAAPQATGVPSPEIDYLYNVSVRRHYNFPNGDAVGYGYGICDKVRGGKTFAQVMNDVKTDVTPSDEYAANYLVSYAVSQFCPEQIWQLRQSAAGYQPPPGTEGPVGGLQGDVAGR